MLDTGFDVDHPDFVGRSVTTQSFIVGETVQDAHGHGTHCIGTSCGPVQPDGTRRYGVATEAEIFAGKVLSDSGSGSDSGILAGINWALANDCKIVSMSLGADLDQVSNLYETVGKRALDRGTLIVAAAGNNARRPGNPGFVGVPANSKSIMAIAALDPSNEPARFSARSSTRTGDGGRVDLAAPGRECVLVVADVAALPHDQRHQHGDAARRGYRRAVARGHRSDRSRVVDAAGAERQAARRTVGRRRRGTGAGTAMSQQNVTVTTDGRDIDATVESLREAGMTVTDVHREIGIVSGTVDPADRDSLGGVAGVSAVEADQTFEIAPPDSDVQ